MQSNGIRIVIPENTKTCRALWKAAWDQGFELKIFPGLGRTPRGISGNLESEEFQKKAGVSSDERAVVVSNGWTVKVPLEDIHPINGSI